jgi:uncharacterized protein (DUF486 family)
MEFYLIVIIWIVLNVAIAITMDFAMFSQTTEDAKDVSILEKIITSEFWASIEWMFVIPANRIAYTFLSPAQMSLSSYVFDFMGQIGSNMFWLNLPTTIDDYVGMLFILFGMYVAKFKVLG